MFVCGCVKSLNQKDSSFSEPNPFEATFVNVNLFIIHFVFAAKKKKKQTTEESEAIETKGIAAFIFISNLC